jgi:histidinol-phosphate aminotransferase
MIPVADHIKAIAPYIPGKPIDELAREMNLDPAKIVKLASNENPNGPSPKVRAAISAAFDELTRYPDGAGFALKAKIAQKFGVDPAGIVLGNGSNDVLELVSLAFLGPNASAVYAQHSFAVYMLACQARGARHIQVPAVNYGADLDAMAAAVQADTRVLFIANPNNPTGTFIPPAKLEAIFSILPSNLLIVLDEAYTEFLPESLRANTLAWVKKYPNLLISRTMSKAYGLASLRVGFAVTSPQIADMMNRVRQPFNVNSLAQAAAIAALDDDEYLARSADINARGMKTLTDGATSLGLKFIPSLGNFVCIEVGDAARVNGELLKRGVIVRPVANYGLPHHLRVSIGTQDENAAFLRALTEILA